MLIALIIAAVTLGVLTGWLIDRHHTKAGNTTDTDPGTGDTSIKEEEE